MEAVDLFIILDDVQFRKNYFQNRNRFLNNVGEEEWFTVPVQKKFTSKNINEVLVSSDLRWKKKIVKQLQINFKVDLGDIYHEQKLLDINMKSIEYSRQRLSIETPMLLSSHLNVPGKQSEKLVNLCNSVGATKYVSGPFGKEYLDTSLFDKSDIKIEFFEPQVNNYYSILYNLHAEGKNK